MRVSSAIPFLALGACLSLSSVGCGGGGVNVPEGPMPQGGTFSGVWHSPQYGEMHMVQTGQQVIGEYTKDERSGRIQGTVRGNVMRFEWSEQREMVSGVAQTTRGRGYFRYAIGDDGDHYIQGEWGHDDNIAGGGPWNAVRDRRAQPEVSVRGEGDSAGGENFEEFDTAGDGGGGGGGGAGGGDSGGGDDLDLGDL
ncbi:MAG: hypothetical protein EVA89_30435 [Sandaracinaceae bacterium]|nr:MAG: hypothetical protein EVA89_30435 [Sandaracinaceae bacterium]